MALGSRLLTESGQLLFSGHLWLFLEPGVSDKARSTERVPSLPLSCLDASVVPYSFLLRERKVFGFCYLEKDLWLVEQNC